MDYGAAEDLDLDPHPGPIQIRPQGVSGQMFSPDIGHVQASAMLKMRIHCPVCSQSLVHSENMNNSLCLTAGLKIRGAIGDCM